MSATSAAGDSLQAASASAEASAEAFIDAFNAQDHERLANTLNYPHVRLAGGTFTTIASAEAFVDRSRKGKVLLEAERWHHTVLKKCEVVHGGPGKVHLALSIDRCREDGEIYNHFETLWIATLQDGHWGIQLRSLMAPTLSEQPN